jgi:hypothetical protein
VTEQQVFAKIREFKQVVDDIYGIYLDSTYGFSLISGRQNGMRQLQAKEFHFSSKQSDNSHFTYGRGNPNNLESYFLHECTMQKFRERNAPDGLNYKIIGNLCLVLMYQYWENHYRIDIQKAAGLSKNVIKSGLWGDIRQFRESIIHNRGIANLKVDKCSILTWFKAGDEIFMSGRQFEMLISYVYKDLDELPQKIRDLQLSGSTNAEEIHSVK